MIFGEDYGDQTPSQFVEDSEEWLRSTTRRFLGTLSSEKFDDVMQEGRIALWQAYSELSGPDRIAHSMQRAKNRMMGVGWRDDKPTGGSEGRRYEPKKPLSIQSVTDNPDVGGSDEDIFALFGWVDHLSDVELAYHHGEIAKALDLLTPNQRRYVYARFWCGIDASGGLNMNVGVKAAREANPAVRDRSGVLWTGNKTTVGAKQRLAEALAHLAGV